jgi:hypothetical protein
MGLQQVEKRNGRQNTTKKTKDQATQTSLKSATERYLFACAIFL